MEKGEPGRRLAICRSAVTLMVAPLVLIIMILAGLVSG